MSQPEPSLAELRAAISDQLKQQEQTAAGVANAGVQATPLSVPDPRSLRPKEAGDPGAPLTAPRRTLAVPASDIAKPPLQPGDTPGFVYVDELGRTADEPIVNPVRAGLNVVSGGATEAVAEATKKAPGQAAEEVQAKSLKGMSPQAIAQMLAASNPSQQSVTLVRTPGGWIPSERGTVNKGGETSKDPAAVAEARDLQERAGYHDALGLEKQQEAERTQTDRIQQVQQNEFRATQEFKRQNDELDDRYNQERQAQFDRLKGVQKAMDAVPNAPRTIKEKMAKAGFEDRLTFGLAALFAVGASGKLHDGGASGQNLIKQMQGNIDLGVKKEQDEFARFGDRAKIADNIYARVREGVQDDRAALNITKALYYDAAMNTVEQIAGQYKMDMQSPQISQLMANLLREREKLVMDTASTLQSETQAHQSEKYRPPGVAAVGGAAPALKSRYPEWLQKQLKEYHDAFEKKGGNSAARSLALYEKAISAMKAGGYANDEKFWSVFAAMNSADSPAAQAAILSDANLGAKQREAMQNIIEAGSEQLKDESGKAVTANELARDIMKKGGYSITSLDTVRDAVAKKRENIYFSTDAGFGGAVYMGPDGKLHNEVGDIYRNNQDLSELRRENPGIGTSAPAPIDPSDIETRVQGRLE